MMLKQKAILIGTHLALTLTDRLRMCPKVPSLKFRQYVPSNHLQSPVPTPLNSCGTFNTLITTNSLMTHFCQHKH